MIKTCILSEEQYVCIVDHVENEVKVYDVINEQSIFNIFFNELDSAICLNGALGDIVNLLNYLSNENELLKTEIDYIQNSISEHIKHQKTELGQKALKEIIEDYNNWLLGHKEMG